MALLAGLDCWEENIRSRGSRQPFVWQDSAGYIMPMRSWLNPHEAIHLAVMFDFAILWEWYGATRSV